MVFEVYSEIGVVLGRYVKVGGFRRVGFGVDMWKRLAFSGIFPNVDGF